MAHETIELPGLADDEQGTLNRLLAQLEAKERRNRLRSAYFDMRHAPRLIGSVIPPQYWRAGIVLGWSGKAVTTLARRCNLDGYVWADGDLNALGFRDLWEDNNLGSEVSQAMVSSLVHGVAFAINTQGLDGEPESLIHFKSARNATGEWNGRARRLDNLLSITSRSSDGGERGRPTGLVLYLDGKTFVAKKVDGKWAITNDHPEHSWGVPAEPLVYQPRTDESRPFGSSRISRAVMSLQDQATRTAIRLEAHGDIYAIPDLWLFGADESIFKNADGSQKESWQIVMGRIKGVPDDEEATNPRADVKHFPAASPQPHLDQLKQQAMLFSGETSIPLTSLGVSDMSNPTSADSYIASREDLIAEAEGATDDWRPALRRAVIRGLAIKNGIAADEIPDSWKTIDTKFRSPIYLSRAQEADAGGKQIAAIPWLAETTVGLELLGLDAQQIERAVKERRQAQGRQLLGRLTQADPSGNVS